MPMKHLRSALVATLLSASLLALAACNTPDTNTDPEDSTAAPTDTSLTIQTPDDNNGNTGDNGSENPTTPPETDPVTGETLTPAPDVTAPDPVVLTFTGNGVSISVSDSGITSEGNAVIITRPGAYELTGDLSSGQVRVNVPKTTDGSNSAKVELTLNNFTASNNNSCPLYIQSADKATIILAAGSVNRLEDAAAYNNPAGVSTPNACLYSADDLTIKGNGTLYVTGKFNNGIGCKNDLRIKEGTLVVTAINNIIKGNDSVEIEAAKLTLSGGEDAIKTEVPKDPTDPPIRTDKGYILITAGANINITCSDDALQAANSITVEAGAVITGNAGGDKTNCAGVITVDEAAMQVVSATQP